jgi:hypothetical protein
VTSRCRSAMTDEPSGLKTTKGHGR